MTTSYSTLLRLALQGTGDNPNTWGQVANQQVFELIETAISGYETINVSGSSDITLSVGNGVPDQARYAMLEMTGLPISNINLFVPTVTKSYIIRATFSGSNTVTVKTTSGSGVTFKPGDIKLVFCDGLDVIDVTPDLGNLAYLDTITSAGLLDPGVITTSAISPGSITLDTMASAATGSLITYNVSGNPTLVTAGSVGQMLVVTSNNVPAYQDVLYKFEVSRQVYETASATWVKPANLLYAEVEVQAGGGGSTAASGRGGGGGGGYAKRIINATSLPTSVAISVGMPVTGANGQGSDFGGIVRATPGLVNTGNAGGLGGIGIGGDFNVAGGQGSYYTNPSLPGGGDSFLGGITAPSSNGRDYGSGAGGFSGPATAGGKGIVIVTEYKQVKS